MGILAKQNVLITGGTGFAGRYAIKRLLADGHNVFALVRDKAKLLEVLGNDFPNLTGIDVENPEKMSVEDLKQLMVNNEISSVIHIAAIVGEQNIAWDKYFEVNVLWTKNLATAFLEAEVSRKNFIFTSSVGVYGTIPKFVPAAEDTAYNPDGSYHESKVLAEEELLGLKAASNLPLIILRPAILYGHDDRGFLFKLFKLMRKKRFPLCRSNPCIHLLDVEVLANVYTQLVSGNYTPTTTVFNVADMRPVKIGDLSSYIVRSMDAGYLKIPSFAFSVLTKLFAFNQKFSVSLKLISKSWYYNVDALYETFDLNPVDTIESLNNKYLDWYKGVGDIG